MNHIRTPRQMLRGLSRPTPLSALVEFGSDQEAAWNDWLTSAGFPPLEKIGRKAMAGGQPRGWDLPWRWPPQASDAVATGLATRFAEYTRSIA